MIVTKKNPQSLAIFKETVQLKVLFSSFENVLNRSVYLEIVFVSSKSPSVLKVDDPSLCKNKLAGCGVVPPPLPQTQKRDFKKRIIKPQVPVFLCRLAGYKQPLN